GQRPQQVQAPPYRVPRGTGAALDEGADPLLGGGHVTEPVVGLHAVLGGGQRRTGAVEALDGRGEQLVVEGRVGRRARGRAQQLPLVVARELGLPRGLGTRAPGGRVDPGEQRAQVLVLQGGLAGRPVPGQHVGQGEQQRRAGQDRKSTRL